MFHNLKFKKFYKDNIRGPAVGAIPQIKSIYSYKDYKIQSYVC